MALNDKKITAYANPVANLPDNPTQAGLTAAQLKAAFDANATGEIKTAINGIIDVLMSVVAGDSGADNIGSSPIVGVDGITVKAQLESIKSQLTDIALGEIPDGTITDDKLSNTSGQIKARVSELGAYAVASGTNTYAATITGYTLAEGKTVRIKFTNANTGAATLNINNLGAKNIVKGNGSALISGNIKAGQICNLVYTGTVFQLLGEGGEYGTATAGDVLSGATIGTENGVVNGTLVLSGDAIEGNVLSNKTFYSNNAKSKLTGTIPSKSAATITPGTTNQVIAANQYLSGAQTIAGDANLVASNIKTGISIFGVTGTVKVAPTTITAKSSLNNSIRIKGTSKWMTSITKNVGESFIIELSSNINLGTDTITITTA